MKIGLGIVLFFFASQLAVVTIAVDNWVNHIFLPSQMMAWWNRVGVPTIAHGGLWSDIFVLPYIMCFMLLHSREWGVERDWKWVVIGIVIAFANQILCNNMTRSDPLGFVDLKGTLAIAVHFVYMATYIAVIGHFFFNPVDVNEWHVWLLSVLVCLHVAAGTHVFLGLVNLWQHWSWCPDLLSDKVLPYMNAAVWLIFAGLAWIAAGMRAGLSVAVTGAAFAMIVVTVIRTAPR